jgi:alpha-L-fucosidase
VRTIEGKNYYMPGEVCDPIGKEWFWVEGDMPRSDESLLKQYQACRARGVNLLLDVPPQCLDLFAQSFDGAALPNAAFR